MTGWIGRDAVTTSAPTDPAAPGADVAALLRAGLAAGAGAAERRALATAGAVAAADDLAAAGMSPALLARVAEAVRAAGVDAVAALPQPVPDPVQATLLRAWLAAAVGPGPDISRDTGVAAWLGAVCVHLTIRRLAAAGA